MNEKLGWFENNWGNEDELFIPLLQKGITRGNGIFETILILQGKPKLLKKHLKRWQKSACLLNMKSPPSAQFIEPLIHEAIEKIQLNEKDGLLRVNWSKKNIDWQERKEPNENDYYFWLEVNHNKPSFESISTMISKKEQRNAKSLISQCKSFAYLQSFQAKDEAQLAGYDDALLLSTNGKICCGSTSNLIVKRNDIWLTPSLDSGCLPGIMRQQGIEKGIIQEASISLKPELNDQWLLINSLSCRPIKNIENHTLDVYKYPKDFWISLLSP